MVKLLPVVATAASLASLCSGAAFYTVLQRFTFDGKLLTVQDQLQVYDDVSRNPCTPTNSNDNTAAFCGVAPRGDKFVTCSAQYKGSNPWKSIDAYFRNTTASAVDSSLIDVSTNDGKNFIYISQGDTHCAPFKCNLSSQDGRSTVYYQGFRCQN